MSKKTLIILLVIVVVGILVIIFAGRGVDYTEESVPVDDDMFFPVEDFEPYEPVVEEELMEIEPNGEELMEEELMEEDLLEE